MGGVSFEFHHPALDLGTLLSLWTLCLAPLIAHVVVGVPNPVHLCSQQPRWWDRAVLWNPTTIIWRYFTIFDRRVRAKKWNRETLASSNALFWTSKGWIGGEDMIRDSTRHCIRFPSSNHAELLSRSFMNTVIVTLQGVQALYQLLSIQNFNNNINVSTIFLPLALLGLVRLPAALWVTDDFAYTDYYTNTSDWRVSPGTVGKDARYHELAITPIESLPQSQPLTRMDTHGEEFHPRMSIRGLLARALFLTPILAMTCLATFWAYYAFNPIDYLTGTGFFSIFFWLTFTFGSTLVFLVNMINLQDRTTVVPGVSSLLYRLYTASLFLLALSLFITASLETKTTMCGKFTVLPGQDVCPDFYQLPTNTLMIYNATAMDGSVSGTGVFNATNAYLSGIYQIGFYNASLDTTPETAKAFWRDAFISLLNISGDP